MSQKEAISSVLSIPFQQTLDLFIEMVAVDDIDRWREGKITLETYIIESNNDNYI